MRQGGLILAAGRVRSKKKKRQKTRNPATPKTHHEIHSSPATVTTSRRRATKHVPRVSSYSVSYTHLRAHETEADLVCRLLLEKKKHEIPPHPKHTTKSTAARRPRPPRDGVRRNTYALCPYSPASIDPGFVEIGLVQLSQ